MSYAKENGGNGQGDPNRREETDQHLPALMLPIGRNAGVAAYYLIEREPTNLLYHERTLMQQNTQLHGYLEMVAGTIRETNAFHSDSFLEGAALSHLILRLHQQQQTDFLQRPLSVFDKKSLPEISVAVINDHLAQLMETANESQEELPIFFHRRGKILSEIEPDLAEAMEVISCQRIQPLDQNNGGLTDEQAFGISYMIAGGAEMYYVMSRTVRKN